MPSVHSLTDLTAGPRAMLYEGGRHGDGVELSFFVTSTPPRRGPPLHVHPDAEVFLVEEGEARFTIGNEEFVVSSGQIVMVPPETPHRFENTGDDVLRIVSIQPSSEVQQANVQPGEPTRGEPRE
jgi:mannose-6-phosphate isomerase-like protein (cupin superfamily)